jgi:predicted dehydrogenase/threonine dehydrogenase-like Zn-dependent dehydrogenase
MRQLLQRYDNGEMRLADVPVPGTSGVQLVVETRASLISPGTERSTVEFGRANLLAKARSRPDQVKQVLEKLRTDGLATTMDAVRSKMQQPFPLGYCSAGVVVDVGSRVHGFAAGDRVVTNGPHSEYVRVPHTLAARIPPHIGFDAAAFTPLGAIALQGIRMASPTLGETVVVYGLGVIGLLTVQLLRANGCRVIGIDRAPDRLALAADFGAIAVDGSAADTVARVMAETRQVGADAVLLTLASSSDEPVHEAAAMSRKRGRIVLVGVTGLQLRRDDFYRKELTFAVSCSYGPGRYEPEYEDEGRDYPLPFVRWTEQRNFEAVLELMATGALNVARLITHRFPFNRALDAYALITGNEPSLGVLLEYEDRGGARPGAAQRTVSLGRGGGASALPVRPAGGSAAPVSARALRERGVAAVIGAGAFAQRVLLPAIRDAGFRLHTIASGQGTGATVAGENFGFAAASTDADAVLADPAVDTVFVLTRHDTHARFALHALEAGKHVFVEKPLALSAEDLDALEQASGASGTLLTVGFNRRFAPLTAELIAATRQRAGPLTLVITVNAGAVPADHWTQHPELGGGRIAGEGCHFIDLARAIVGAPILHAGATAAARADGARIDDITHITMEFADGSTAAIHYLASGARSFPKERVEAFVDGRTLVIENWRRLRRFGGGAGGGGKKRGFGQVFRTSARQDKGHEAEIERWYAAVRAGHAPPIPLDELFEVSRWTLRLAAQARGRDTGAGPL